MEDVLEVYHRPYNVRHPVICMDESNKQIVFHVLEPIADAPGRPERINHEYIRKGVADIFMAVEPLTGFVSAKISQGRTRKDWAIFVRHLLDDCYPDAEKVVLVRDNLNTHETASLIELSAMTTQCLNRRFEDIGRLSLEVAAWEEYRNQRPKPINWQFRTAKARIKLKRLYQQI